MKIGHISMVVASFMILICAVTACSNNPSSQAPAASANISSASPQPEISKAAIAEPQKYTLQRDKETKWGGNYWYQADPWGQWTAFTPPAEGMQIRKVLVSGQRTDFPNVDKKYYTINIWDRDFKRLLYSADYPYTNFTTTMGMVGHEINPPITVRDDFTVDFISRSEYPGDDKANNPSIAIFLDTDFTTDSNLFIGTSYLGDKDLAAQQGKIKMNSNFLHASWVIRVEGLGLTNLPGTTATAVEGKNNVVPVSDISVSSEGFLEGDSVTATVKVSNASSTSNQCSNVIYVDRIRVKTEDIHVEPKGTKEISYAMTEPSACVRYLEVGNKSKVLVYYPKSDPSSVNMTALNMMNNKVPNVIFSIGRNVTLKENSFSAKNPTYAELKEFLKSRSYLSDYYASETLHNDAEAAGIKCAFVWWQGDTAEAHIESSRGLANTFFSFSNIMYLNAFQTTDKGLVFIYPKSLGCVLYLEKGKPVGLIDISNAVYTNYDYFEKYSTMVDSERKRISKVMTGYYPVIPGFPSYNKLTAVTGKCDIYW